MSRLVLIDPYDFQDLAHGNGCAATAASIFRALPDRLAVVGVTSTRGAAKEWTTTTQGSSDYPFLALAESRSIQSSAILSANADFAARLSLNLDSLEVVHPAAIVTTTYSVLWILSMLRPRWKVIFIYPGLGNPMLIGRHPRLGRPLAPIYERIQAAFVRRAWRVYAAAPTEEIARYVARLPGRGEARVLPFVNSIDVRTFYPAPKRLARSRLDIPDGCFVVTGAGRLARVKGWPLLLEAIWELKRSGLKPVLLALGEGEEETTLRAFASSIGVGPEVRFLGRLPPAGVAECMAAADVFAVSSYSEGLSYSMLEAAACGRPIVSTAVSGADRVVCEGRSGLVVRYRNPKLYAEALQQASCLEEAKTIGPAFIRSNYSDEALKRLIERDGWLVPM